jgi:hypothetical protein
MNKIKHVQGPSKGREQLVVITAKESQGTETASELDLELCKCQLPGR